MRAMQLNGSYFVGETPTRNIVAGHSLMKIAAAAGAM